MEEEKEGWGNRQLNLHHHFEKSIKLWTEIEM